MSNFTAGDEVTVKTTGARVTVVAVSTHYVMIRTKHGSQWTYAREELHPAS
jgi:uncharacterized protein YodC (DUF2158 family)